MRSCSYLVLVGRLDYKEGGANCGSMGWYNGHELECRSFRLEKIPQEVLVHQRNRLVKG